MFIFMYVMLDIPLVEKRRDELRLMQKISNSVEFVCMYLEQKRLGGISIPLELL